MKILDYIRTLNIGRSVLMSPTVADRLAKEIGDSGQPVSVWGLPSAIGGVFLFVGDEVRSLGGDPERLEYVLPDDMIYVFDNSECKGTGRGTSVTE